jgi:hypothetical protein
VNIEGLRRTLQISRVPTWLPPTAPRALSLFDSPAPPASAINNTVSASPAPLTICHVHFLKHGVVETRRPTPRGRPLCEAAIFTV